MTDTSGRRLRDDAGLRRMAILTAASLCVLWLSACATATPYQPATKKSYGYSEEKLEDNRYKVSFSGNSLTDQRTVADYLLYRAAELTVDAGKDYFVVTDRNTNADRKLTPYYDDFGYYPGPFWPYPYYGYYSHFYPPYYGYDGFGPYSYRSSVRYDMTLEIVMYSGHKPANNPNAYDARDVMKTIGPRVTRPEVMNPGAGGAK